jgi:single-stranded DNA-binding protein
LCNQYLSKGRLVLVEGEIAEPRVWEAKDGTHKASLELTAREVRFLSSKSESEDSPREQAAPESGFQTQLDEEEIPF